MNSKEKYKRLMAAVKPDDTVGILITADPDAMASAMALKRLFWRKTKKVKVFHTNIIDRPDNLAFIKLLKINQQNISYLQPEEITKWAIIDSQPDHNLLFAPYRFDIIIDHHPGKYSGSETFVDIRPDYGATSSMMLEYIQASEIELSERIATALLYGIKTDTDNFIRHFTIDDITAFRYLMQFANMNIIKKIESSELTRKILKKYNYAINHVEIDNDIGFVHMNKVKSPDTLVIIADFLLRIDEVAWSVVSGLYNDKLIIIFRNSSLGRNAGKIVQEIFGKYGGTAGGHKEAARVELPLSVIGRSIRGKNEYADFVRNHLSAIWQS